MKQANSNPIETTVLIIDDSATIRRLADSELSAAGYLVHTAADAEEGIAKARELRPAMILLDHQLPGTTGFDVSTELMAQESTASIPVVISSTLRKKAYAEYVDLPNVVDMLPKPYTPELLITTVQNALDTATMVVQSQSNGSAVPEVIDQIEQATLAGKIGLFGVREIIDLVNNGKKSGAIEFESAQYRVWVFVADGRIQAVTASGIEADELARNIPESLSEVAPIMKFTIGGRRCSEIDGIVELLNNKVLDPRLLKQLLRQQAAYLVGRCFDEPPSNFRFDEDRQPPPLFNKLKLDSSLSALLVENASMMQTHQKLDRSQAFARKAIRGQNLDRSGLSAKQLKILGCFGEVRSINDIFKLVDATEQEIEAAIRGFLISELIEERSVAPARTIFAIASDPSLAKQLQQRLQSHHETIQSKVVRDWIAIRMLLRKSKADAIFVVGDEQTRDELQAIQQDEKLNSNGIQWIGIKVDETSDALNQVDCGLIESWINANDETTFDQLVTGNPELVPG